MGILYYEVRTYVLVNKEQHSAGWRHRNGLMTGPGSGSRTVLRKMGADKRSPLPVRAGRKGEGKETPTLPLPLTRGRERPANMICTTCRDIKQGKGKE